MMVNVEPDGPYVYQPIGACEAEKRVIRKELDPLKTRLFGVAGVSFYTEIKGLTRREAKAVCAALRDLPEED